MSNTHIILLSGGSGTRLWPLSTNSRPKQFLKVLRDDDGRHVSMVQRVFGQINRVDADFDITVATSAIHKEYLETQLDGSFTTVLEPERRDTAPAIMLACANLSLAQGADSEDTVIVAPIDTYAGQGYYDRFPLLAEAVRCGRAELVLLGVKPTYPSEKYGYILPDQTEPREGSNAPLPVIEFKEKPDSATAKSFIAQGGLWNCGVFAFKLGYLTAITERYYHAATFEDLRAHYSALPKNSFDYEVVEKASSVVVVSYEGEWKDLGTWNTLTDEMAEAIAGRVVMDDQSCSNVHVVNETNMPLVVAGLHDAVVVATPDGILATGKEESAHIKTLVQEAQLSRPMYERRAWGEYRVLSAHSVSDGNDIITQELVMPASDKVLSLSHVGYSEVWTVVSGSAEIRIDGIKQSLEAGDVARIPAKASLRILVSEELRVIDVRIPEGVNPFLDVQSELNRWEECASQCYGQIQALKKDENELADSFCRDVTFGTGGIRAKMGAGPNRINVYTVSRATQGLANWLLAKNRGQSKNIPTVAIAFDTRRNSDSFARATAEVLTANGIKALLMPEPVPTPVLSFAVREYGCLAGVVITASHNRAEYNGYKVYGPDGCQATSQMCREIWSRIKEIDMFAGVKRLPIEQATTDGLVVNPDDVLMERYEKAVLEQSVCSDIHSHKNLSLVYTPLNGTGEGFVPEALSRAGFAASVVEQQCCPDPEFTTCRYPNPESVEAWACAMELAKQKEADIAIATDPDCDRMGVLVKHGEEYRPLTGDEVGVLLLDWLCEKEVAAGRSLENRVVITTIVTTPMIDALAASYGFELRRTLTGFKYIGEQIGLLEREGQADRFLFGLEESIGYLKGTYVRDKDGVVASLLAAELAAERKEAGTDLVECLSDLYKRFGFHSAKQISVPYPGIDGPDSMRKVLGELRNNPIKEIAGLPVRKVTDYLRGVAMPGDEGQMLPKSNVLQWDLQGGSRVIVRPSGTEPKLKAYLFAKAGDSEKATDILDGLTKTLFALMRPGVGA